MFIKCRLSIKVDLLRLVRAVCSR